MSPARIVIATFVFALFCVLVWLAPEIRSMWILWREKRAIAKRQRDDEFWRVIGMGQETRRMPSSLIDQPRGQFSSGREEWDRQGVHK